jgi:hypothetical protein
MSPTAKAEHSTGTTRFDAIVAEANRLNDIAPPYSNARPPSDSVGYDCSSSCADLLQKAGYDVPFFNTATAPQYMQEGEDPSGRLTFWNDDINGTAGNSVHIFAVINGRGWGTGANAQGGPGWHEHTTAGFKPYHVNGLDEPAKVPQGANTSPSGGSTTTSGETVGFSQSDLFSIGRASAFSTQLELPGLLNAWESQQLKGTKSIYNDEPLMGFVEQLCKASLRHFQSLPNGAFFAFFPDAFGIYGHRVPYWNISNVEIVDGGILLNDEALATHVFVAGDTMSADGHADLFELAASKGVVTIFDAFTSKFMINQDPPSDTTQEEDITKTAGYERAYNFLRKYGVRPYFEDASFIRNPYFEMFYAFTQFQLLWANQYQTTSSFTFMPELYPGGIVAFEDHGIQCYIDSVTHSFDYESGFTTQASLSAPSALKGSPLADQMVQPFTQGNVDASSEQK